MKAQISIFFILAAIVFLFGASILVFENQKFTGESSIKEVKLFVDECLDQSLDSALSLVMAQGGYYQAPFLSTSYENLEIPYYWIGETSFLPGVSQIEEETALAATDYLLECVNNFASFPGKTISVQNPKATVTITEKDTIIDLEYPVSIIERDQSASVEQFRARSTRPVLQLHKAGIEFIAKQYSNPNAVPIQSIAEISHKHNINYQIRSMNDNDVLFLFSKDNIVYGFVNGYEPGVTENISINKDIMQTLRVKEES